MLPVTHQFIEVEPILAAGFPPCAMLDRKNGEHWYVIDSPVIPYNTKGEPVQIEWAFCRREQQVYIPLIPYITADRPSSVVAFVSQLTMFAMCSLTDQKLLRCHVATGTTVFAAPEQHGLKIYLGFAFQVRATE